MKLNNLSQNAQNRRSSEKSNCLFETCKNSVMPHGRRIYETAYVISMAAVFAYPQYQHALPHCKYVLSCCSNFPRIGIPDQESDRHHSNAYTSMRFHIYHLISRGKVHV